MKVIALGHRRFVGKDTLARFIINHLRINHADLSIQKIAFADELKRIAHEVFRLQGLQAKSYYDDDPNKKEEIIPQLGISARDLWIKYGNQMREYHNDIWVELALDNIYAKVVIITDLRYPNEAKALKELGAVLIRIDRPSIPKSDDVADTALDDYEDWDYIIENNDNLTVLHDRINAIVNEIIPNGPTQIF